MFFLHSNNVKFEECTSDQSIYAPSSISNADESGDLYGSETLEVDGIVILFVLEVVKVLSETTNLQSLNLSEKSRLVHKKFNSTLPNKTPLL